MRIRLLLPLVFAASAFAWAGSASDGEPSLPEVAKLIKPGGALIVDVREADELVGGMVSSAIWLATSEIERRDSRYEEILQRLPRDLPIYVYCEKGVRSRSFVEILASRGFQAINLGGYAALASAGFPIAPVAAAKTQPCPYLCGPYQPGAWVEGTETRLRLWLPREDGRYVAFIARLGEQTRFRVQLLDTAADLLCDVAVAPAPPPSDFPSSSCARWRWDDDAHDGFVDLDSGILRFAEPNQLEISYGKDDCRKRASTRTVKRWSLSALTHKAALAPARKP